MEDIGLGPF